MRKYGKTLILCILSICMCIAGKTQAYAYEKDDYESEEMYHIEQRQLLLNQTEETIEAELNRQKSKIILDMTNKVKYAEIPQMFQTDYPDVPFSGGDVASSGCGISCLAMVATYITDVEYTPGDLGARYDNCGGSNVEKMEYGIIDLHLPFQEKTGDWNKIMEALANHQPIIMLMNENSIFTDGGHFVIAEMLNDEGKIVVKDPYYFNVASMSLKDGFENGFTEEEVREGMSGAWVFEAKREYGIEDTAQKTIETFQIVQK